MRRRNTTGYHQLALSSSKINALRIEVRDHYDYEKFTMVDSAITRLNTELSAGTFQIFDYGAMNEDAVVSPNWHLNSLRLQTHHRI
jgi:hypothetical protein